ncbi:MAG: ABC transporter ATP-binding protein [Clostridiales bacterium]|nr:ABC transporter ATP-binding protein [Clostridiales bacterium]
MTIPLIHIKNIVKTYTMGGVSFNALDGVSMDIYEKEFVSIVGPSGSGKSTFMNMLGCLDVPTSGEYYIQGEDVSCMTEDELAVLRNKTIGFIFQGFNLLSKLTAYENVELPLIYQGISFTKRKKLVLDALGRVGLANRLDHKPSELSGGQQQRVAIARALSAKPPIILADEPTGNLDSKSGAEVMNMLKELHQEGKTIILITHDNNIAMEAQRIVRIADGKITMDSKKEDIKGEVVTR